MALPLLLIPVAVAATGSGLSAYTIIGSFTLGGGAVYYLYNGVSGWIDPNRVEKRDNELLANLLKVKEERDEARVQNLNEVVNGIQQRRQELDNQVIQQQTELQDIVHGIDSDRVQIQRHAVKLAQTTDGLEQTALAQEELITRLQRELQEKMAAFEDARRQLKDSDVRFEQATKELAETKEQTAASKAELAQVKEELTVVAKENREKDSKINLIEQKVLAQEKTFKTEISQAQLKIDQLLSKNQTYKNLVKDLTEQLEEAQESKQRRPVSPSFFK
jgi:chromosome segregation ATPase